MSKSRWNCIAILFASSLILAGCSGPPPQTTTPTKTDTAQVTPINAEKLRQEIESQKGKVLLVNFWATWCKPCVEELPALAELQSKYEDRGLKVLLVSADESDERETKVAPFLAKHNVTWPSYIIDSSPFQFAEQFDPDLKGSFALPRTYIFNKAGEQVDVFSESLSLEEFGEKISSLL